MTDNINYSGQVATEGDQAGTSPNARYSAAGGLVGWTKDSSRVESNLNTGEVRTSGDFADAGGALGRAFIFSKVSGNLNTGEVRTSGSYADAGGVVGAASALSKISGNLNTGEVRTSGSHAYAGGTAGEALTLSKIRGNLNTGEVLTNGWGANAGGAAGLADSSTISGNLNTGEILTSGRGANAGGAVGEATFYSIVSGNLNTGEIIASNSSTNSLGIISSNETEIQSGKFTPGDNWSNGTPQQYPIPRNTNPAYQDLVLINGTNAINGTNLFPVALAAFAEPGDSVASLFNQDWNTRYGYLPFLKNITRARAINAGINCEPGGFACSEESVTTSATTEPMTMATVSPDRTSAVTTQTPTESPALSPSPLTSTTTARVPTPSTEPTTGNCPAPVGIPDFQVFDPNIDRLYVVAHQSQTNQLLLIRYTADGSLDEAFGSCGAYTYSATGLSSSFTVTSGIYREEGSRRFIYLSTLNNNIVTLVRLDIDQAASQAAYSTVDGRFGAGAQINAMMTRGAHLYFTGESGADLLLGESAALSPYRADGKSNVTEAGHALMVDGDYLYVTGRQDTDLLIRKYTRTTHNPVSDFGDSGVVTDPFAGAASRGQALALHGRALYVVGNLQQGENDLVIRRYGLDGQRDDSFTRVIHTGIAGLDAVVKAVATNNVLSVFKYDPEDSQVVVRVFDWQGQEVGQHELLSSFTEGIAAHGLALDPNTGRVYFAGRHSGGTLSVESLVIPQLAISGSTTPLPTTTGPTESAPGWVWPTVGAAVVTVATVTVVVLGIVWAARHYSMRGDTGKP